MDDITPTDAHAAHVAMIDMEEAARKYQEKKPGSSVAESFARKAAGLKVVRGASYDEESASTLTLLAPPSFCLYELRAEICADAGKGIGCFWFKFALADYTNIVITMI